MSTRLKFTVESPSDEADRHADQAQALSCTTDAIRELVATEWQNTIEIGRHLNEILQRRLWSENPEVLAYAEKSKQHPGGEALTARHLNSQGIQLNYQRIYQLSQAAVLADQLQGQTRVLPSSERQVRPLIGFKPKLSRDELTEIWNEAVDLAEGEQPTSKQVKAALQARYPNAGKASRTPTDRALAALKDLTDRQLEQVIRLEKERRSK